MLDIQKFVPHKDLGIPIRLSPTAIWDIHQGLPTGEIHIAMVRESPLVGNRTHEDTLAENFTENVRLRRIAREVSPVLCSLAESWQVDRYCTIVHGSVARGVARHPNGNDPSDIDIDLVVDGKPVNKEERKLIREQMYQLSDVFGARIDCYTWSINDIRANCGQYARLYLGASAYRIANKGGLWEEIVFTGIESQQFLTQNPKARTKLRRVLRLIADGKPEEVSLSGNIGQAVSEYLQQHGFDNSANDQEKAAKLYAVIC